MKTDSAAILIAGPTASGKSALALELAEAVGGTIINADSMQVYPVLSELTARPGEDETARVPHLLYGHADIRKPYSVAKWLDDASRALGEVREAGRVPVFTGGSGLYFRALLEGLSQVPAIPEGIREAVRETLKGKGAQHLHGELVREDTAMAQVLRPSDGQRIARALEVVRATGRSLLEWQRDSNGKPLLDANACDKRLILPERAVLHERINERAARMLDGAALAEVRALLDLDLPGDATVLKAIGVEPLMAHLRGTLDREEALARLRATTRQYAKRQSTWFRNQLDDTWRRIG